MGSLHRLSPDLVKQRRGRCLRLSLQLRAPRGARCEEAAAGQAAQHPADVDAGRSGTLFSRRPGQRSARPGPCSAAAVLELRGAALGKPFTPARPNKLLRMGKRFRLRGRGRRPEHCASDAVPATAPVRVAFRRTSRPAQHHAARRSRACEPAARRPAARASAHDRPRD